jgi:23S rRNA (guanine745-N1)-methyltransferase
MLCPVRNCHLALTRDEKRLLCERGHSFDVARSGYVNLLQPQERRSKNPGDTAEAVAARRRLHDRGVTMPLLQEIGDALKAGPEDVVLDAGCGDGFYLGTLQREHGFRAHGIDISIPAVEAAARKYPDCEWIVGNADRFVPYADGGFTRVMSITARMNAPEFRRVIQEGGILLVALSSPYDLIELRGVGRDRVERTLETFARRFELMEKRQVTTVADLDADAVRDVGLSIYRPLAPESVMAKRVTFSLDLLVLRAI